jgi:hypothetical protein
MKKKTNRKTESLDDELRPEYPAALFRNMRPNRFANHQKIYKRQFVILDEDVSNVFDTDEAVNAVLRGAIRGMERVAAKRKNGKPAPRSASSRKRQAS